MKSIFQPVIRDELIQRISKLNQDNERQWGKMNVYQMVKHNTYWNEWVLGKGDHNYKQSFMGKILGKIALRKLIRDEKPIDKNIPTSAQFKFEDVNGDLKAEKTKWTALMQEYENFSNPDFIHEFMGKMTREQIGILVYKHTDHHLRQFGI